MDVNLVNVNEAKQAVESAAVPFALATMLHVLNGAALQSNAGGVNTLCVQARTLCEPGGGS
jgi:hypothetical protein